MIFDPVGGPYSEAGAALDSPGRAGISWSALRPARSRSCRSTWCCSRAATSSACSGARGCGTTRQSYRAALAELAQWCAQGKLSCHVHEVYPLAETPQAIKALAERQVMGKLVVQP